MGSATLVYGLALIYGSTGSTQFSGIATAIGRRRLAHGLLGDPMLLTGLALVIVGFAFKASVAPFHQWTPDVYEGAPTPVTAFMATATKAAALGVLLRFFDVAALPAHDTWAPALADDRRDHDHRRQRRRAQPVLAQAHARLLERRPGRLHAVGRHRRPPSSGSTPPSCTWACTCS